MQSSDAVPVNYVVTAHPPSWVTHSAVGNFLGDGHRNLILAKVTRFEVFSIQADGLVCKATIPVNGRIVEMALYRPPGSAQDNLVVLIEKQQLAVLRWDAEARECCTVLHCDVKDHISANLERKPILAVDPTARCIGLHVSPQLFKIIPIAPKTNATAFNVRMTDDAITDIVFLEACRKPTIAVLSQDADEANHVRTFEISMADQDMYRGPWSRENVDHGAQTLIPMPGSSNGVILVAEATVMYMDGEGASVAVGIDACVTEAYAKVDLDGSRFLLADHLGVLRMLVLDLGSRKTAVEAMAVEKLGVTSIAAALSYLDNGYLFVGSEMGDSQLVRLSRKKDPATESYAEVVQTYTNIGPITDFCIVKSAGHSRHGQGHVVTCSGGMKDGSLRVIRNGIGITEQASVDVPGIRDMWSLRRHVGDRYHSYLVQSYATDTRILELQGTDQMGQGQLTNIDEDSTTLYIGNAAGDLIVQVTAAGVNVLDCASHVEAMGPAWTPPDNASVLVASGNESQLLLAITGGVLCYLEVDAESKKVIERSQVKLENEVSCLSCNPLGPLAKNGSSLDRSANVAAAGLWAGSGADDAPTVQLLSLPTLETVCTVSLQDNTMARSVLLATLEGHDYFLIALGDGHLQCYKYGANLVGATPATAGVQMGKGADGERLAPLLHDRRRLNVGTQPASLSLFPNNGSNHVFAACDRPTVVYAERGGANLLVSNVNLDQVTRVCSFDTEHFPESLAIATDEKLHLGAVDKIQKLHIQTIRLGEQARRIVHLEHAHAFAILSESTRPDGYGDEILECHLRLLSDSSYKPLDSFKFETHEVGLSLLPSSFKGEGIDDDMNFLVVGTGHTVPNEPEAEKGRILFFTIDSTDASSRKLKLVGQHTTSEVVYTMVAFDGRLLAGVKSELSVFSLSMLKETLMVKRDVTHHGHTMVVRLKAKNDFILAGDMMRSAMLLSRRAMAEDGLEQLARDYDTAWIMSMEILEDDTFIIAEQSKNLVTLRRNAHAATDTARTRLERVGLFHAGALINRIQHGSLVMQVADDGESPVLKSMLFATADGMLGIIATLKPEEAELFLRVQQEMASELPGIGGFKHSDWRKFTTEAPVRIIDAVGYIDGDLVEAFLELPQASAERVAEAVGKSVEELTRRCEAMQRLH